MDYVLFIVIFINVFIWYIFYKNNKIKKDNLISLFKSNDDYYSGISFLLNDEAYKAAEIFLESFEVNKETLNIHLLLGNQFRNSGDFDQAIRIHSYLLTHAELSLTDKHKVRMELARDFKDAGLYDRAQRVLADVITSREKIREEGLLELILIYQEEKDWDQAIQTFNQLKGYAKQKFSLSGQISLAHYHCERAESTLEQGRLEQTRKELKEAQIADKNCVRATLLLAKLEYVYKNYLLAIKILQKLKVQYPEFILEGLSVLRSSYIAIEKQESFYSELIEFIKEYPFPAIVLAVIKEYHATELTLDEDIIKIIKDDIPSLWNILVLLKLQKKHLLPEKTPYIDIALVKAQNLIDQSGVYICSNCGFSGKRLHWLCPQCLSWDSIHLRDRGTVNT